MITKEKALDLLKGLAQDFSMLASGEWVADDDSCSASLEAVDQVRIYIESQS